MKFRRTLRFHGLKRPRVRQSWNKFNLFNLYRARVPSTQGKTFFQQKWAAKSVARGYHGEHIKENRWNRMFDRRLESVVNMNPRYMAEFDGSEQAAGRGSGRHVPLPHEQAEAGYLAKQIGSNVRSTTQTPYMQMTFAPMERRLDIAVFRALFASSARQARQFVVHGAVKVNGKKMIYPGYLLNPGDMFEVDPDRVLFGTGAKKEGTETAASGAEEGEEAGEADEATATEGSEEGVEAADAAESSAIEASDLTAEEIKALLSRAKTILDDSSEKLNVKRKRALRQFIKDAKTALNKANRASAAEEAKPAAVVKDLTELLSALSVSPSEDAASKEAVDDKGLTVAERERFEQLLALDAENPIDPSKPYATPWRPRPYMAPFAFIPRYLEVNQNICAAVYLRHPVARPGSAEVPTPYPSEVNQLAHNWYLRRH